MCQCQMHLKLEQNIDSFIELLLTDAKAEEFKSELLLDVKAELKVKLGCLFVRQHVVDQISIAS